MGMNWGERRALSADDQAERRNGTPAASPSASPSANGIANAPAPPAWPRTTRSQCAAIVEADLPVLIRRREELLTELQALNEAITDCLTLQLATVVGPQRRMRRQGDAETAGEPVPRLLRDELERHE